MIWVWYFTYFGATFWMCHLANLKTVEIEEEYGPIPPKVRTLGILIFGLIWPITVIILLLDMFNNESE